MEKKKRRKEKVKIKKKEDCKYKEGQKT